MKKYKIPIQEQLSDVDIIADDDVDIDEAKEIVRYIAHLSALIIDQVCEYAQDNDYDPNDVLDCVIDTLDLFGSQVDLSYYETDEDGLGYIEVPEGNGMLN